MPFISYPKRAVEMYVELETAKRKAEEEHGCPSKEWSKCFDRYCGFMDALRIFLDSTQRGCVIMEGDSIIETGDGCLSKLVLSLDGGHDARKETK